MLGVGGGTAIHQLNRLLNPAQIVGIELDPVHIKVAKTYFGLTATNIKLIQADAFTWMKQSRRKFDVIVDDLFVDAPGDPVRPFNTNRLWLNKLQSSLTTRGVLIQNHLSPKSAKLSAKSADWFSTALLFTTPQYENAVLALYQQPVEVKPALAGMKTSIEQIDKRALGKLKYRVKRV